MRKMLITGLNGFLGGRAKKFFQNSFEIYGIDRNSLNAVNTINGMVTVENLLKFNTTFDVILHFAGSGTVLETELNKEAEETKNIGSSKELLNFILKYNRNAKLFYSSSAAVYGNDYEIPISENAILNPVSLYGKQKLEVEKILKEYASLYNLDIKIIRFFSLYGEGLKKQVLWDFSNRILTHHGKTEMHCYGTGNEVRDFIHVDDALNFINMLLSAPHGFDIYNCGSGKGYNIKDIFNLLLTIYDTKMKLVFDNKINKQNPSCLISDNTKIERIGFKPAIPFNEGVMLYANWFKKEN